MIVREVLQSVPEERIIARAIFADNWEIQKINDWITKYYSQLIKLKSSKVRKSDMMFYLTVKKDNKDSRLCTVVSGITYSDVKNGIDDIYGIEFLNYRQYASLYVPDYTIQRYGKEVVASEALREYGWNGYDSNIVCPDDMRLKVLQSFADMKQEIYPIDCNYYTRCRLQFCKAYEGKAVPQYEDTKNNSV